MGNQQSEVDDGVKNQVNASSKVYNLVSMSKGGTLIEVLRTAMRTRDFDGVDDKIREQVLPFLYNDGKGKQVPISTIIRNRNKQRGPSKRLPASKDEQDEDAVASDSKVSVREHLNNLLDILTCKKRKAGNKGKKSGVDVVVDTKQEVTRLVCWKLSERGAVGESALHLCLLVATIVHLELARRLVKIFPVMINDIHVSDEYFGENALHMAVVNEDPRMVKFLLDNGADVHERCYGNFFTADDQKQGRVDTLEHEPYKLPLVTNYEGHAYWGETSLAFAACLELEDCYRLLLAKKSNADSQDSNGNTVLHMCVIVNKINMFNLAYELGAETAIDNSQGLTPLSLAAKLTRVEMFFHILKLQREVYWQFCEVAYAAYVLGDIDSIDERTGAVNTTSALTVVAFGEELGHLDMMEGVLVDLLKSKWDKFAKKRFFLQIKIFCVYFFITFFAFTLRPPPQIPPETDPSSSHARCPVGYELPSNLTTPTPGPPDPTFICWGDNCDLNYTKITLNETEFQANATNMSAPILDYDPRTDYCYLNRVDTPLNQIRTFFELLMVLGASYYLFAAHQEYRRLGRHLFLETWSAVPGRVMFITSCLLIVVSIPFRITCQPRTEDRIMVVVMFLTPMHFLYFCRGFQSIGPFVVMIYKMVISDLLCFVLIYMVFVFGFAEAFFVIFRSHRGKGTNLYFSGVIDSVMTMFLMSLGEFGDVYAEFDNTDHAILAKFLFLIYMIVVSVLMVNMLIAMMGHTYEDIASRPNEWLRQWARIVLIIERGLTKEQRLDYQTKYAEMRNGTLVFFVKWPTTEEERQEIEEMKELKVSNLEQKIKRRKDSQKKMA